MAERLLTLRLKTDTDAPLEEISMDIRQEINCCCHLYEIVSITEGRGRVVTTISDVYKMEDPDA